MKTYDAGRCAGTDARRKPPTRRYSLQEAAMTVTLFMTDGSAVEIDEELPFRVHVEDAAKLQNVQSIQSADGTIIYFF